MQLLVERMPCQRAGIAEDDEFHACARHRHVHAAQVAEKAYLPFGVGTDEGDEDDVALLTLEAIDGVHADEVAEGFEKVFLLYHCRSENGSFLLP